MWNPDFDALAQLQDLAGGRRADLLQPVGRLRRHHQLRVLPAPQGRRRAVRPDRSSATNEFFEVALGGMITLTAASCSWAWPPRRPTPAAPSAPASPPCRSSSRACRSGNFFGAVWFFMLFLAAITSSLSMLQPAKAFFEEALGMLAHGRATLLVAGLCLAGNLFVLWFSKGLVGARHARLLGRHVHDLRGRRHADHLLRAGSSALDRGLREAHERRRDCASPAASASSSSTSRRCTWSCIFVFFCWLNVPGYVRTIVGARRRAAEQGGAVFLGPDHRHGRDADGGHQGRRQPLARRRTWIWTAGGHPTTSSPREARHDDGGLDLHVVVGQFRRGADDLVLLAGAQGAWQAGLGYRSFHSEPRMPNTTSSTQAPLNQRLWRKCASWRMPTRFSSAMQAAFSGSTEAKTRCLCTVPKR